MLEPITNNPAAFVGALRAVTLAALALVVAFGLPITADQRTAILDFTGLVIPVSVIFSYFSHKATVPKEPTSDAPVKSQQIEPVK